jgi:outer membrane protein
VKAASKSTQLAKSDLYPTLSLSGQLGTNYSSATRNATATGTNTIATSDYVVVSGNNLPVMTKQTNYDYQKINYFKQAKNNFGSFIGLNLQVPIFNGLQSRNKIALAKVQEKNTHFIAENTRIQLQQAIEQAYLNMSTAFEKYKLLGDQVKAFEESFRAAEIKFNLGAINSVDYLIVKNNLDRANVNFTIAQYEYLLRTKVLDFYQGILK